MLRYKIHFPVWVFTNVRTHKKRIPLSLERFIKETGFTEKKSSCLCHSQITWAEQEADFDTFKYTKEYFGEKRNKRRYITILQHLKKYHSGLEYYWNPRFPDMGKAIYWAFMSVVDWLLAPVKMRYPSNLFWCLKWFFKYSQCPDFPMFRAGWVCFICFYHMQSTTGINFRHITKKN